MYIIISKITHLRALYYEIAKALKFGASDDRMM